MIDWRDLAFNALWIVGGALVLAAISHAWWAASQRRETWGQSLGRWEYQRLILLAAMIYCIGQAGVAEESWRLAAWVVLAVVQLGVLIFKSREQM